MSLQFDRDETKKNEEKQRQQLYFYIRYEITLMDAICFQL